MESKALGDFDADIVGFCRERQRRSAQSADRGGGFYYFFPLHSQFSAAHGCELVEYLNAPPATICEQAFGNVAARITLSDCVDQDTGVEECVNAHWQRHG